MITLVQRNGFYDLIIDGVVIAVGATKAHCKALAAEYDFR